MKKFNRTFFAAALLAVVLTPSAFAQTADLAVTKTGPATANADDDVSYTVAVTNLGPAAAAGITLSDEMPEGMTFVSAAQDSGPPFVCSTPNGGDETGTVTCTGAAMASGETAVFTIVFDIPVGSAPGASFTNVANVASTSPDPNGGNNSDDAVTTLEVADLALTKSAPAEAPAGSDVAYTIIVTNFGPDTARNIIINDDIPAGMTFVSATQESGPAFICSAPDPGDPGSVTCTAAALADDASAEFTFVFNIPAQAPSGMSFTNFVTVTSDFDPNDENDTGVTFTTTPPPPEADLGVSKGGPTAAGPGTDVVYTITVSNNGPTAAENFSLEDTLPGTLTFVSLEQNSGATLNCSTPAIGAGGTITCTAASFPVGTADLTLKAHVPGDTLSGTEFTNSTIVSTSTFDPNEENNSGTFSTTISAVDLVVTKSGPATANAGDELAYTITLTNTGDFASSVTLTDVLPAGTTFVSLEQEDGPVASCTTPDPGQGGTVTCTYGFFTSGVPATVTLTVLTGNVAEVANTVSVMTAESFDTDGTNDTDTVTTTLTPAADLSITKTGAATANAGENVTYTITAVNEGPSPASSVSIEDVLPVGTTFVSLTRTNGPVFSCATPAIGANGTITCTRASFAAGNSVTFSLVVRVAPDVAAGTEISNTAEITTTTLDPDSGNDQSTVATTISVTADLGVTKAAPSSVDAGANLTYLVTATNAGPSPAANVTLEDVLPAGTTFVSATQTSGPTFNCTLPEVGTNGTVTCTIAQLDPLAGGSFSIVVAIPASTVQGTVFTNTATVDTTTTDPDTADDSATVETTVTRSANLSVTKTAAASVPAGQTLTYSITATNAGTSDASVVTLEDVLPTGTTFASLVQETGPVFNCTTPVFGANGTVTCTLGTFAPATATFTLVVVVDATLANGTALDNTATIISPTLDPDPDDNSSTATTTVITSADLEISKSAPETADAGTVISYTIAVTNAGPSAAVNVTLTDILPAGVTVFSATRTSGAAFNCTTSTGGANDTATCTIFTFDPGASATFDIQGEISQAVAEGTVLQNTATIEADTPDPDAGDDSATDSTTVTTSANLGVTKIAPNVAAAGEIITYVIGATNDGPSAARNVTITDALPSGVTFVSVTQTDGPTFNCTTPAAGANGTVTCTIATFDADALASFELRAQLSPALGTGTLLFNTATIASTTADPSVLNDSSTERTFVNASADFGIVKSAPGTANAGDTITYAVTVTNAGPSNASVMLTDMLPAEVTFVSATQTSGPTFNCTTPAAGANGTITCTIATLDAGGTAVFSFVVKIAETVASGSTVANTATVGSLTSDPNENNDSSTATTGINTSADVGVTKSVAPAASAGENLTYTVTATNAGPSTAQAVTLTDALPPGTTFVSATQTAGPAFNCTTPAAGANGTITCTRASLLAGASATFSFVVQVSPSLANGTVLENTATIDTTTTDPDASDDTAVATTTVAASADLGLAKSAAATITAGETLTYTVTATSAGPSDASNVTLADALPAGTTFVSATQTAGPTFTCATPAAGANGTITCTRATFEAGASAAFSFVVQVLPSLANGSTLENTATIDSTTTDPGASDDSATATTTVATSADLGITKNGPTMATAGSEVTYTITVTNDGPSDAASVSVTDAVPANTTFVSATQTSGPAFSCTTPAAGATGTITCTIASLANGASAAFSLIFTIPPATPDGTVIMNVAEVDSTTADPNAANDSASADTTVGTGADVTVSKSGPAAVTSGTDVTYTVSVGNAGPSNAADVTVTDEMPDGTTFVSVTQTAGPTFGCTTPAAGANGTITCNIASLAAGAEATFELVFHIEPGTVGPIQNTASVSSPTDSTPGNTASSPAAAVATGATDVSITKTASADSVSSAGSVTYTIVVTNLGPDFANDTVVTDNLPAGTTLSSVETTQGTCSGASTVTCTIGTLAPNAQATITLVVDLPATPGSFTNSASVEISNADLDPANDTASATVTVAATASIPALSPLALLFLALTLATVVLLRMQ